MLSGFMLDTWVAGTLVAVVAGAVGFFVVLRGSAFVAHAIPHGAFGGAAGAALIGVSSIAGLAVFALAGALGIGTIGRRARHDVATALSLVVMLGTGALFLSWSGQYASAIYSLLFGEVLGVAPSELWPIAALAAVSLAAVGALYRPLLLTSALPEMGAAQGVRSTGMELAFLVLVALTTTLAVPVVGALLMFSLMVGPAGTAALCTNRPARALSGSVAISVVTVWIGIAASYRSNWPIGFFVGILPAFWYAAGRAYARRARARGARGCGPVRLFACTRAAARFPRPRVGSSPRALSMSRLGKPRAPMSKAQPGQP